MTHQEFKEWKQENTGIIWDQCTDDDVTEYCLRIKATDNMEELGRISSCKCLYFPKVNKDEAALTIYGHHTMMDGISTMKGVYLFSDNVTERKDYYPFTAFLRTYTWPQWIMMLLTAPYAVRIAYNHIMARGRDINCIRPHDVFMQGII